MLARLEEIEGVAASRVDWTGTRFLLDLESGIARDRVEEQAIETLGEGTLSLADEQVREVLESYRKGETWMRAGETLQLSRFEAGVLAERYGSEAAAEIGLGEAQARRLVGLFRQELERAFERTHAGRGVEDVPEEVAAATRRILDASASFLGSREHAALAAYLERFGDS